MYYEESRTFSFTHEGVTRWMSIPAFAELTLRDGSKKAVWQMEEGEEGRGSIELYADGSVIEVWFTCIEP